MQRGGCSEALEPAPHGGEGRQVSPCKGLWDLRHHGGPGVRGHGDPESNFSAALSLPPRSQAPSPADGPHTMGQCCPAPPLCAFLGLENISFLLEMTVRVLCTHSLPGYRDSRVFSRGCSTYLVSK